MICSELPAQDTFLLRDSPCPEGSFGVELPVRRKEKRNGALCNSAVQEKLGLRPMDNQFRQREEDLAMEVSTCQKKVSYLASKLSLTAQH
jgi:hypothetical protein